MNRAEIARIAPELQPELAGRIADLLEPMRDLAGSEDPDALRWVEPPYRFDAAAAWGPSRREGSVPKSVPVGGTPAEVADEPRAPLPPVSAAELPWLTVCELAERVRAGQVTAGELAAAFLSRVEELQPRLNSFITVVREVPAAAAGGTPPGPLAGIPVGLKDIICTAGVRTTGGSALLENHTPTFDAECWRRLRAAGAVLLGKLNTHEFAAGTTNENDRYGPARNPWDPAHVAGGSSGGSAAAVAAAMVSAAIGTDTGGSIRIPAACCGVVGIKPTYGLVPRDGVFPQSWSIDHVGPLARTVRDAARVLDVLAGGGSCEPAALAGRGAALDGWRVGVPRAWLTGGVDPDVASAFQAALATLGALGASVVDVQLPSPEPMVRTNRAIAFTEATAWHAGCLRSRPDGYGADVRPRLEAGRFIPATEYVQAQRLRALHCRRVAIAWGQAGLDVLALPTVPLVAPVVGAGAGPAARLLTLAAPFNVLGAPAASVPCGFGEAGLPVGLQLVAPPGGDAAVCFVAAAYEAAAGWRRHRPALSA